MEVALALKKGVDSGISRAVLAADLHLDDASMITRFLRLLTLSPEVQDLVDWGPATSMISFTSASEFARMPAGDDVELARAALELKLSTSEVKQVVQARLRSGKPMSDCIDAIVRLRPNVERRYVFVGAVRDEASRRLAELRQDERDEMLVRGVHRRFPEVKLLAARLATHRFTLVGDKGLADALAGRDFEAEVNASLGDQGH